MTYILYTQVNRLQSQFSGPPQQNVIVCGIPTVYLRRETHFVTVTKMPGTDPVLVTGVHCTMHVSSLSRPFLGPEVAGPLRNALSHVTCTCCEAPRCLAFQLIKSSEQRSCAQTRETWNGVRNLYVICKCSTAPKEPCVVTTRSGCRTASIISAREVRLTRMTVWRFCKPVEGAFRLDLPFFMEAQRATETATAVFSCRHTISRQDRSNARGSYLSTRCCQIMHATAGSPERAL